MNNFDSYITGLYKQYGQASDILKDILTRLNRNHKGVVKWEKEHPAVNDLEIFTKCVNNELTCNDIQEYNFYSMCQGAELTLKWLLENQGFKLDLVNDEYIIK